MTEERIDKFIDQFDEKAQKSQVITVKEIAIAYDKATEKKKKSIDSILPFTPPRLAQG